MKNLLIILLFITISLSGSSQCDPDTIAPTFEFPNIPTVYETFAEIPVLWGPPYPDFADEVYSIGDYILTGGELASLVMTDAISRMVDGVLGNSESLETESYETFLLEAPSFSKPANYKNMCIPSEFLKGNHSKICALKIDLSSSKTKFFRPDDYKRYKLRK